MNIHKILKFLFPEYQIIESVKRHGFIAKNKTTSAVPQSISVDQRGTQSQVVQTPPHGMSSQKQQANAKASGDAVFIPAKQRKVAGNQIDIVSKTLKGCSKSICWPTDCYDDLFIAFKRPLIAGVQKDKPKNTLIMIGTESIGKNSLIDTAISALKQEKLLNYSTASKVDLSLYPTQSEKPLFLSDLYKVLYARWRRHHLRSQIRFKWHELL